MSAAQKIITQAQNLAVERGIKSRVEKFFTALYHDLKKADLFTGFSKTYEAKVDKGETLPPEKKLVVMRSNKALKDAAKALRELFDITATKDKTNDSAKADIVVEGGQVVMKDCPVTHLLWLEDKVKEIVAFIEALPTLDPADEWAWNEDQGYFITKPTEQLRKENKQKPLVLYAATKEHPAQVQLIQEAEVTGTWTHTKFSGGARHPEKEALLHRALEVQKAVKFAIEAANAVPVVPCQSSVLLSYIFGQ